MKKISLKNLNLKEVNQLSREQLKNVLGGFTGGTGTDGGTTVSESGACIAAINCGTAEDYIDLSCGCTGGGACSSTATTVTCECTGEDKVEKDCST